MIRLLESRKVIFQVSIAPFSGTVEIFFGQRWLSPLEKIDPYTYEFFRGGGPEPSFTEKTFRQRPKKTAHITWLHSMLSTNWNFLHCIDNYRVSFKTAWTDSPCPIISKNGLGLRTLISLTGWIPFFRLIHTKEKMYSFHFLAAGFYRKI